jgi:hypothetical protein
MLRTDRICRLTALAAAVMISASAAQAALPPYWQSAKEIEAILQDQRVHDAFKYEEPIVSIKLQEPTADRTRVYAIGTARCSVLVTLTYKPTTTIGPADFDIEIGKATCQ